MKLVVRADDLGYSEGYNYGLIDSIKNGIVTSAELMVEMPAAEHAAALIRDYPAIALTLHTHFCGKPVLDPSLVPSLVDENGLFNVRKAKVSRTDVNYDEMEKELEAEILYFRELVGRLPDYMGGGKGPAGEIRRRLADKYGIPHSFRSGNDLPSLGEDNVPQEKFAAHPIYQVIVPHTPANQPKGVPYRPTAQQQFDKDVVAYFLEDKAGILNHEIAEVGLHPGYLDDYILSHSTFHINRVRDLEAAKSPLVKQWIRDNNIELVSMTDAIFGTNNYQNYLKQRGGL